MNPTCLFAQRLGVEIDLTPRTMRDCVAFVAAKHGLTVDDIKGPRRAKRFVRPRQEAMWMMRRCTKASLPQIGQFLGGRDHCTVWHGVRRHEGRIAADLAAWQALGKAEAA